MLQKERYGVDSSDKAIALAPDWLNEFDYGEGVKQIAIDPTRLSGTYELTSEGFLFAHDSVGRKPYFTFVKLMVSKKNQTLSYINLQTITRLFKLTGESYRFEFQITDELFETSNHDEDLIDRDSQTIYATTKNGCKSSSESLVTVLARSLSGPEFSCKLGESQPAGTGLVLYPSECTIDNIKLSGDVVLDLGNYKDHFELSLPGNVSWLPLYPCTQIPWLQQ